MAEERPICFDCGGAALYGIVHIPDAPTSRGLLVIVGGPQYRIGSHRQFLLLARFLARSGIAVLRFDYRGMGDSEGEQRSFESIDKDIESAIDVFFREVGSLKEVVLWGLCDAASAAIFYAQRDPRVSGIVLLNPWVRTESGIATAYLRHYYIQRLIDPELWHKIVHGRFNARAAIGSFFNTLKISVMGRDGGGPRATEVDRARGDSAVPLRRRMFDGLRRFQGRVLLILSGDDLTAREFLDMVGASRPWRRLLDSPRIQRCDLPSANHTFSRSTWRSQVEAWTRDWIRSW